MAEKIITLSNLKAACSTCDLRELCLPIGLADSDVDLLDKIIRRRKPLQRGEYLFRPGDEQHAIYAVRSGSIKTSLTTPDGEEHVTGFNLPGELVGLDAITASVHRCSAKALETSSVCEIPISMLDELSGRIQSLRHRLLQLMSQEIMDDQELLLLLGKRSADERLAIFLLNVANRHKHRGLSESKFRLSMSRTDIANYLGLAVETVSRLFARLQEQQILAAEGKEIHILDQSRLKEMASFHASCADSIPRKA